MKDVAINYFYNLALLSYFNDIFKRPAYKFKIQMNYLINSIIL